MSTITYENVESFYGEDFYGKSSGDIVHILGKAKTNDDEEVILLDNRRFVTVKGFNMQYIPKAEKDTQIGIYRAVRAKYIEEIKKIGTIVVGDGLDQGITFKVGKKYFYVDSFCGALDFEIRIYPKTYTKEIECGWKKGIARHLRSEYDLRKTKKLHRKDFEKVIGAYKNEKDFANKFFKKFGFLGFI